MADILSFRARLRPLDEPVPLPTQAELEEVYKVFDTAKSLDDLPLFKRDVKSRVGGRFQCALR